MVRGCGEDDLRPRAIDVGPDYFTKVTAQFVSLASVYHALSWAARQQEATCVLEHGFACWSARRLLQACLSRLATVVYVPPMLGRDL